ncbi:MAG TPA: hypothetical protein ACHBX0_09355 [Arsenophonus sp.]
MITRRRMRGNMRRVCRHNIFDVERRITGVALQTGEVSAGLLFFSLTED